MVKVSSRNCVLLFDYFKLNILFFLKLGDAIHLDQCIFIFANNKTSNLGVHKLLRENVVTEYCLRIKLINKYHMQTVEGFHYRKRITATFLFYKKSTMTITSRSLYDWRK